LSDPENKYNKKHNVGVAVLGDLDKNKNYNVGVGLASARAITLITLVITIVILIILASITINLILRDNGLFEKVKQAKIDLEISEERENIQLAYLRSNRY
jgi:type II secretory pathway pseudopilin PulG